MCSYYLHDVGDAVVFACQSAVQDPRAGYTFYFTQVRLAFLSSLTNEPVRKVAAKLRTALATGRRQCANRCSRIDLLTRYAAPYVTLAQYCEAHTGCPVIYAKIEITFFPFTCLASLFLHPPSNLSTSLAVFIPDSDKFIFRIKILL